MTRSQHRPPLYEVNARGKMKNGVGGMMVASRVEITVMTMKNLMLSINIIHQNVLLVEL